MRRWRQMAVTLGAAAVLTACGGGGGATPATTTTTTRPVDPALAALFVTAEDLGPDWAEAEGAWPLPDACGRAVGATRVAGAPQLRSSVVPVSRLAAHIVAFSTDATAGYAALTADFEPCVRALAGQVRDALATGVGDVTVGETIDAGTDAARARRIVPIAAAERAFHLDVTAVAGGRRVAIVTTFGPGATLGDRNLLGQARARAIELLGERLS